MFIIMCRSTKHERLNNTSSLSSWMSHYALFGTAGHRRTVTLLQSNGKKCHLNRSMPLTTWEHLIAACTKKVDANYAKGVQLSSSFSNETLSSAVTMRFPLYIGRFKDHRDRSLAPFSPFSCRSFSWGRGGKLNR